MVILNDKTLVDLLDPAARLLTQEMAESLAADDIEDSDFEADPGRLLITFIRGDQEYELTYHLGTRELQRH